MSTTANRFTLRDLPLPAKLVVTTFLISVGLGYLWAMAQIHFKHASHGNPLPTTADLVSRFSGVPWPLEPKPDDEPPKNGDVANPNPVAFKKPGIKIKSIVEDRCVRCHKAGGEKADVPLVTWDNIAKQLTRNRGNAKGRLYKQLQGKREGWEDNMVAAFFEKSVGWEKLTAEEIKAVEPKRESERLALIAWIDAGGDKVVYENDRFPLPATIKLDQVAPDWLTETDPDAIAAMPAQEKPRKEQTARERRDEAKGRQINTEHLTQSTHAHLLSFAMLWALTGLVFAFTSYSSFIRCVLSPVVLIAQVADVACWWLARLDVVGPYFALAIMGTGAVVALGLMSQIVLSLFNMYGPKGKVMLLLMLAFGISVFGLTYVKVIAPELQAERDDLRKMGK
jgi:hypothetical protein